MSLITVTKADGKTEAFDEEKIRRSLRRSHIPKKLHGGILDQLKEKLGSSTTTKEIHDSLEMHLKRTYPVGAATYNLRQAIMEFGPSGYPFERFVAAVLETQGYTTEVGKVVQGKCVTHEIDVLLQKGAEHIVVECKFHNQPGTRSDVKVALYTQARYQDVLHNWRNAEQEESHDLHGAWLVTNTKCTTDAIQYAECAGIKVIGWNYPASGSLQELVESAHLYPVTCLTTLSSSQKEELLRQEIVLVRVLRESPQIIDQLHLSPEERTALLQEIDGLLSVSTQEE